MSVAESRAPSPGAHIPDFASAVKFVFDLLHGAQRRQLWFIPLDRDNRAGALLVPMDVPAYPEREAAWPLARLLVELTKAVDVSSIIVALERPGSLGLRNADHRWIEALAVAARLAEVDVRAFVHVTSKVTRGVRATWADDAR